MPMTTYKYGKILAILALCTTLSACLPEDTNVQKQLTENTTDHSGSYGMALGGVAMRIQNAILSDASWFDSLGEGQELNLASLGIHVDGMPAEVKAVACPDPNGKILQMVWLNGSDAQGKFKIDRIGFDKANMVEAIKRRISTAQLGMKRDGNHIAMLDGTSLAVPAGCVGLQNIPLDTPVIALQITRPAAPTTQMTRTEFRTVECPSGQTGSKIQRRVVVHKPDGGIVVADGIGGEAEYTNDSGWRDEDIGKCRTMVEVGVEIDDTRVGGVGSALDEFAALNLRGVLDQRVRDISCMNTVVSKDGDNKDIDTCGQATLIVANKQVEEAAAGQGFEERRIQCVGSYTVVKAPSFGGVNGSCDVSSDWSGTAMLIRTRQNADVTRADTAKQVVVENWLGKLPTPADQFPVQCDSDENTAVPCGQLADRPTGVQDPNKWLTTSLDTSRSHIEDCFAGNCFTITPISLTYLNVNYFTGSTLVENGGINVFNRAYAREWENRETFKTAITYRDSYAITRNQCEWHTRTMYEQCPLDEVVTVAGSYDHSLPVTEVPYATYSNTPPTLTFYDGYTGASLNTTNINTGLPISASGGAYNFISTYLNQVVGMYNQYRAAGQIVIGSTRNFTRQVNTSVPYYGESCWNDCFMSFCSWKCNSYIAGYNTVANHYGGHTTVTQNSNLYYQSWQTGSHVDMNNRHVLNATAMGLRANMCAAGQGTSTICNADNVLTSGILSHTRDHCRMFSIRWETPQYSPGLSGPRQAYCEYIFEEWVYDFGTNRVYSYALREMADTAQRFTTTTILNRDGVISRIKPVMMSSPNRVGMDVVGFVLPLQCARQENDLIEVPLHVLYKSFWSFAPNQPTMRSSTGRSGYWHGGFSGIGQQYNQNHTFWSSAVLRRTTVREYDSVRGWSRPKYKYYSPYYGTFTSLPSAIYYSATDGNDCHGNDGYCNDRNITMSTRR